MNKWNKGLSYSFYLGQHYILLRSDKGYLETAVWNKHWDP